MATFQNPASASSMTSSMKSASARWMHIGGLMRRVLPNSPPLPMSRPGSLHFSKAAAQIRAIVWEMLVFRDDLPRRPSLVR